LRLRLLDCLDSGLFGVAEVEILQVVLNFNFFILTNVCSFLKSLKFFLGNFNAFDCSALCEIVKGFNELLVKFESKLI